MEKRAMAEWRKIGPFVGIGVLYFVLSLPNLAFRFADGYSELRFTSLISMPAGLLFGFPGALACALGNLVGDLISKFDVYCIFGFVGNFLMAWFPYKFWHIFFIGKNNTPRYLDSPRAVLKFVVIALLSGTISVGVIGVGGRLLGGYVYGTFYVPVVLQYYVLSVVWGMLIFHLCVVQAGIVPRVPKGAYQQEYQKTWRTPGFLLAVLAALLSSALSILTLAPKISEEFFVTVLCFLVIVLAVGLAIFPIRRSKATEVSAPVYRPVKGLTARLVILFLCMLSVITTYFTICTFRVLYMDFLYALGGDGNMGLLWVRVLINAAVGATILIAILSIMLHIIQKSVIVPAGKVAEYASGFVENQALSQDRLILEKTGTELDDLSLAVNHMAQDIRDFVEDIKLRTVKEEKLAAELSVARNIQQGMLPGQWMGTGFDLAPYIKPAREVGGDFYHFLQLDENRVFVCIADVSGKDISAAMFMIQAKTLIDAHCHLPPNEMFTRVNAILSQRNQAMMFVTAFAAMIDRKEKTMQYANAGHNPPICCCDGEIRWLSEEADFVLGPIENIQYRLSQVRYTKAFKLFIYTDGVNEAENGAGGETGFFGNDRLFTCIQEAYLKEYSCKDMVQTLETSIAEFTKGVQQSDDITMLALTVE